jgi:pimeloyl-ACP methyl ester carboxylesterase
MILRAVALFLSLALIWAPTCHGQEVLIYLHGDDRLRLDQLPLVFLEMAKVAQWNILPITDHGGDDEQRAFIGQQAARMRREGFRKVYVAGASRGGWMALVAAALDNVDGVIGIAPTTTVDLLWQRNELARRLAMAKTKRIAVVFFDEDPSEKMPRSETTRQALQQTGSAYMFVDRPPDLLGHWAGATGLFARRYRDCLLRLMRSEEVQPGEVQCATTWGYAAGEDIGFPAEAPTVLGEPFRAYSGRWQAENENGAYAILQPTEARADELVAHFGLSPEPREIKPPLSLDGRPKPSESPKPALFDALVFRRDQARGDLVARLSGFEVPVRIRLISDTELELRVDRSLLSPFVLRRQPGR